MPFKVLFVSHDASRTGAPIVFLHLLRWIKENTDAEISILLKSGGDLEKEFSSFGKKYVFFDAPPKKNFFEKFFDKFYLKYNKQTLKQTQIIKDIREQDFDLIYCNTVDSHLMVPILKKHTRCPIISHIHENEYSINSFYLDSMSPAILKNISHFIAVSESTRENLINNFNINPNDISLFYPFIPQSKTKNPQIGPQIIRDELGLTNEFIVGGSGLGSWRKGIDLFIRLALELNKINPLIEVKLIWVGYIDKAVLYGFEYEKKRLGINGKIIFTGVKPNPLDYFQLFDVFALTSREDPFPLVCLEAASLGKPIICFEKSGGMVEFVNKGTGWALPYGDIRAMAETILQLENNKSEINKRGEMAQLAVRDYDVNLIAPKIFDCIKSIALNG
ncbi:glycosyltransferase family 4 protein [Parasediminibacterium sp. JCM 36343]|uniref:glycosyltransferase family 4 protein n=1 Tax=Parasediminibacterium sp. JCM 36343 TaxID=3374279 RepID=UPI00397B5533